MIASAAVLTQSLIFALIVSLAASLLRPKALRADVMPPPFSSDPPWNPRPGPAAGYEVRRVELDAGIDGQKSRVVLRYEVHNTGPSPLELDFIAPLPLEGAVSGLTLVSDGKELAGGVFDKDEAFEIYRRIVMEVRDPALLEYAGRGLFRARVFPVPPGGASTLELSMDHLLPKDNGRVDFNFPLSGPLTSGRRIASQEIVVRVAGRGPEGVYSPQAGALIGPSGTGAVARLAVKDAPPLPGFQLHFQEDSGPMGALILSHRPDPAKDGFFLFLAEPALRTAADRKPIPKTVIFALDRSGSMHGAKFEQARNALGFILDRLGPEDDFNLVDFAGDVSRFRPENAVMTPDNRRAAREYVELLRAGGNTHIDGSMAMALELVDPRRPSYVIFLTDGQPTAGEIDEAPLVKKVLAANSAKGASLFCFGVGADVNSRLLDRMRADTGFSTYIREDESIEDKISNFFSKMTNPALVKPALTATAPLNRVIPGRLPDLFSGGQTVVTGRYPKAGPAVFTLAGEAGGEALSFEYRTTLADGPAEGGEFIARTWAQRRIGDLIEEIDHDLAEKREKGEGSPEPNPELVDELIALSKRYGILTPFTSFLAVEKGPLPAGMRDGSWVAKRRLSRGLHKTSGDMAFSLRSTTSALRRSDPGPVLHLMRQTGASDDSDLTAMASLSMSLDREDGEDGGAAPAERLERPRLLAGRTFFLKEGRLVDSELDEDDLKSLVPVKRFSDEYFGLARRLGSEGLVWLSQAEPLALKFGGVAYLIEAD